MGNIVFTFLYYRDTVLSANRAGEYYSFYSCLYSVTGHSEPFKNIIYDFEESRVLWQRREVITICPIKAISDLIGITHSLWGISFKQ